MPRASVVIPAYNAAQFICRAIDSALAQKLQDVEIIVVDDGSTDNTADVVSRYQDRVLYVRQEHRERSAARNHGITLATGKYIAFLDADDWWLPQKLAKQVDVFESNPELGLVYCLAARYTRDGQMLESGGLLSPVDIARGKWAFEDLIMGRCFPMPTVIVRRECLDEVDSFDESLSQFEDWDLWLRLSLKYQFGFVPEVLAGWLARGKFFPHAFAHHHALDARLCIVERALQASSVPVEIRARARAQALWFTSLIYLALGRVSVAREHLVEASHLRRELCPRPDGDWLDDLVSLAMWLFDTLAPEWMAFAYLRFVFASLPAPLRGFTRLEGRALGMLWTGFGFHYQQRGDAMSAQRCMRAAVRAYWPLIRNPGVLSIAARGMMLDRLRPFAKKIYQMRATRAGDLRAR